MYVGGAISVAPIKPVYYLRGIVTVPRHAVCRWQADIYISQQTCSGRCFRREEYWEIRLGRLYTVRALPPTYIAFVVHIYYLLRPRDPLPDILWFKFGFESEEVSTSRLTTSRCGVAVSGPPG